MREGSIPIEDRKLTEPDQVSQEAAASWNEVKNKVDALALNPILGMHRAPRETLKTLLKLNYPLGWAFVLMMCSGICHGLNRLSVEENPSYSELGQAFILGGIAGVLVGLLISLLVYWVGKLFKGKGTYREVIMAWGWSCAPSVFILVIWGIRFAIVGPEYFNGEPVITTDAGMAQKMFVNLTGISLVLMIWQMIMTVIAVSVVHQYRKLAALSTLACVFIGLAFIVTFIAAV